VRRTKTSFLLLTALVLVAMGAYALVSTVGAHDGDHSTGQRAPAPGNPPDPKPEKLDSISALASLDFNVLVPNDPEAYKVVELQVFTDNGRVHNVSITLELPSGAVVILDHIPGASIPFNRTPSASPIRGNSSFEFSNEAFSEVGWIEDSTLYKLFGQGVALATLKAVANDLVPLKSVSNSHLAVLQRQLDTGRRVGRLALKTVAVLGPFEFVRVPTGGKIPLNVAVPDADAMVNPTVEGSVADVEKATPFRVVTPKHNSLRLVKAKTGNFIVPFGRDKGKVQVLAELQYEHAETGARVVLEQRPIPLDANDRIPVVVPNEQGQYELTILKDNGLQGYALRYKATGGTIVKWYSDGMLYTLGGELPVETLVEIAKSVR